MTIGRGTRIACAIVVSLGLSLGWQQPSRADSTEASLAYQRATAAFGSKDYALAASEFARADDLQPNPVALESALKAALLADDPVLGMVLVERAESRTEHPGVKPLAKRARDTFGSRAGRLKVTCPDERPCSATLAQPASAPSALEIGKARWVAPGAASVELRIANLHKRYEVEVPAGQSVDFRPAAPLPEPAAESPSPLGAQAPAQAPPPSPPPAAIANGGGVSPAWFVVGAAITGALLGVTIWSGVDTLALHDAFEAGDDGAGDTGQDAQLRTNILLSGTLASAAGTAITAIFVDWGGKGQSANGVARGLGLRASF